MQIRVITSSAPSTPSSFTFHSLLFDLPCEIPIKGFNFLASPSSIAESTAPASYSLCLFSYKIHGMMFKSLSMVCNVQTMKDIYITQT
ncbi:hypothetical protein LXL04_011016 [Taraxacum kok-saghyz]